MKWMCLTARHHEGFCLFDSPYPGAFTSMQTLHRDLVAEYVTACRAAGLKVGLYYSPLSWRYPGYYDVTGKDCQPNKFGFITDPTHVENARLMKEENYVNVKKLLTGYGKIDYIFWDGAGWASKGRMPTPRISTNRRVPRPRQPLADQSAVPGLGSGDGQAAGHHGHGEEGSAGRDHQSPLRVDGRHRRGGRPGRDEGTDTDA